MVRSLCTCTDGHFTVSTVNFISSLANHYRITSIASLILSIAIIDDPADHVVLAGRALWGPLECLGSHHISVTDVALIVVIGGCRHTFYFGLPAIYSLDDGVVAVWVQSLNNGIIPVFSHTLDDCLVSNFQGLNLGGGDWSLPRYLSLRDLGLLHFNLRNLHQRIRDL